MSIRGLDQAPEQWSTRMEESVPAAAESPASVGAVDARVARGRRRLGALLLLSFPALALARQVEPVSQNSGPIRIGTTAVILDDQVAFLNDWQRYLEQRLARDVIFVQRGSYREITALINSDQLDIAWVCGYPYVANRATMRLLAMPLYNHKPLYQSYLIVPRADTTTQSYAGLKGKIFAYSDPNSNSGFLVPQYLICGTDSNLDRFSARASSLGRTVKW